MNVSALYPWFRLDGLSGFVLLGLSVFFALTMLYSFQFMKKKKGLFAYYTYIILTAVASIAAVLSNNLIVLLVTWGFLGLTLYLLINLAGEQASPAAKKTFIIIGGTDALMLLGIGIVYYLTGTFQMDEIKISLAPHYSFTLSPSILLGINSVEGLLPTIAYLCIAVACFAKAGAMPFHSWIPDCAEQAPVPVVAYLPASLDKLLGIYLLARLSLNLFEMNTAMNMLLMIVGAFTIVAAVMMALVQHNMKRLLGYHAVSQVGYMVLGIGTANPIGIAGGLFHMLNNSIYKQALFLVSGNVEKKTRTTDLDKLGGLSKAMPLTYISALIASLSISGVPPFNGFVSKWMVYQGLISNLQLKTYYLRLTSILCLVAAMFGSGLTLASFMKLIHATFLGQPANRAPACRQAGTGKPANEVGWQMWLPCIFLAGLCVLFGVFAYQIPLKFFILPAVGGVVFLGSWYAGLSTLLIFIGLLLGLIIFKSKNLSPALRSDAAFIGAEPMEAQETAVSGTEFYNTIKEMGILKGIYKKAEAGVFDIYEQGKTIIFGIGKFFQYLHNGILPTYLVWILLGTIGLFLILIK